MGYSAILILITFVGGAVCGIIALYVYRQMQDNKIKADASKEADRIVGRARSQAHRIEREATTKSQEFETRARRNAENEIRKEKQKMQSHENSLKQKEQRLDGDYKRKEDVLLAKMRSLEDRNEKLKIQESRLENLEKDTQYQIVELQHKLESVSAMTTEQARAELRAALEEDARKEIAPELTKIEEKARREADQNAKKILAVAISRYANEVATERTVSIVPLTSDEMKGKIIGREGRNIRALEAACGVDLIIDETPEAVVISSFDPVRRQIAKLTLEKLMADGRVHPGRIEEVVEKVKGDLLQTIKQDGEKAAFDLGLASVNVSILNLIGSMKYRMVGAQNLYDHCLEVANIAGLMAAEIGEDVTAARRAGLLHDLGQAIDHTVEGSVWQVGADFAKRYGERDNIVQAIRSQGIKDEGRTLLGHIVFAANAFSEARPGANSQMIQNFTRRLEDLESVANSFDGVVRTYALQSGKEIRVLVESSKITDDQANMLSRDIARKIERELNYPGQIKVSVVRETRIVEHAR
ncbi:MAG: ribonuclease Y [Bdellovibrionales bacterium RBG_16_40_8]|nr:MAG: ribonuclease Y [Bdellovibrionales bacterium RBG_16_40_8]